MSNSIKLHLDLRPKFHAVQSLYAITSGSKAGKYFLPIAEGGKKSLDYTYLELRGEAAH